MNYTEFDNLYGHLSQKHKVMMVCECGRTKQITKEKAIENISNHNDSYICRSCAMKSSHAANIYSEDRKNKISNAKKGKKQTEETKSKISEWRKAFYKTPEGKKFIAFLSEKAAKQHANSNLDKSKRKVFYISVKNNNQIRACSSSGEYVACEDILEKNVNVVSYETQVYYKIGGRSHSLDFLIYYADGTKKAIEIKPKKRLTECNNVIQIADSMENAENKGWEFEVWTEKELNIKNWKVARDRADEYVKLHYDVDYAAYRAQRKREKAKRHYDNKIAVDKVEVDCEYCNEKHYILRKSYKSNIDRNGRYICEREGGHISGSKDKPTLRKENPHAAQGMKQCLGKCGRVLPFECFGKDKSRRDGYASRCKECRCEEANEKYRSKMTSKTTKAKLLEKAINELLEDASIVDGEIGGGDDDGVALWVLKKDGDSHVIYCWYFDWHEKYKCWTDKPISEMEGPALLTCPIRFFSYKSDPEDVFEQWRYEVKKYHEEIGPTVQDNAVAFRLLNSLTKKHN